MPPYTIQKLDDEPIILMTLHDEYRLALHGQQGTADVIAELNALPEHSYCIFDMRKMILNFNDILYLVSLITQPQPKLNNPNATRVAMVTEKGFIKAAMEGLRNPLFGNITIPVFDSREAALAYVREQIAAGV